MTKAFRHQAYEFKIGRDKKARALLWPMRSGKSKAVIDKTCYQFDHGRIEGCLIIAPNGVHINWTANEIPKWAWPELTHATFAWSTPKRNDWDVQAKAEAFLQEPGLKWLAVNMEALNHPDCQAYIRKFMASCHRKFHLVVSEAHHFGRPGAKRTRLARGLAKWALYRTVETGTVILNSPLRAFSIFEILSPMALGFEKYRPFVAHFADFMQQKNCKLGDKCTCPTPVPSCENWLKTYYHKRRPKLLGYKNMDELRAAMGHYSSVVLREEIDDMPELIRTERPNVLSDLQRRAYLEMVSRFLVETDQGRVAAPDAGPRMQKLQQIVNGYLYDNGKVIEIDPDAPIYDAMLEQVGGTLPGKSIVWCRFREDIRRCAAKLKEAGYHVLEYHGGVPTEKREAVRLAFQNDPKYLVLLMSSAGGEGKDFSAADAVIFFSSTPNAIHYQQAEERATLIAGRSVAIVRLTTPGTVDDRNYEIIDGKISLADTVSGRGLRDMLLKTDI